MFPRNGLLAACIACHFESQPWLVEFVTAVYRANLADDRDISSDSVIADCLAGLVADPAEVIAAAQSPDSKLALRAQTARAVGLGIFGAPSLLAGNELFWGSDRLDEALSWALAHPDRSSSPPRHRASARPVRTHA